MSRNVRIELSASPSRSYDIHIGSGLIGRAGALAAEHLGYAARAFIVYDAALEGGQLEALESSFAGDWRETHTLRIEGGEGAKSWRSLEHVVESLLAARIERRDLVVAFGGGVIGDLAGLAAGLVNRGAPYLQVPSTLLAQVDSSVGGKTAINAAQGKNLVGLFNQPIAVIADLDLLSTLPPRELRAGLAETLKYGAIDDPAFFDWVSERAAQLLSGDAGALAEAVARSVEAKARVVAADETERGRRALLNLGHTFGHALETHAVGAGALIHGEAVAAGMALAFGFSAAQGLCPAEDAERMIAALARLRLPTGLADCPGGPFEAARLLGAMRSDKKNENGQITLILARGIGEAFVERGAREDAIERFLRAAGAR